MDTGNWITVILFGAGVFFAAYGFVYRLDKRVSQVEARCENHTAVINSIADLNRKLDKVANDNEVFWRVIGPHLEDVIHSPKSVDRDALVAKLTRGTITKEELPVLIELLNKALCGTGWTPEKRFAGMLLLARATALLNDEHYERRRAV